MRSKSINKLLFVLANMLFFSTHIYAQAPFSDSIKMELNKVSLQIFVEHNRNFLIVDAILDGLIVIDSPYTFEYDNGKMSINSEPLPAAFKNKYTDKLNAFKAMEQPGQVNTFSMYRSGITLKEIFDPSSIFRKSESELYKFGNMPDTKSIKEFFSKGKMIDTAGQYTIRYNVKGLFINDKKVPDPAAKKYISFINDAGFKPEQLSDYLYITRTESSMSSKH